MTATTRRSFLKSTAAAAAGGAFLGGPLQGLAARGAGAAGTKIVSAYGEPVLTPDQTTGLALLAVPPGFRYWSFGWTGEPMSDGHPTPNRHDGMAAFPYGPGDSGGRPSHSDDRVLLVRNHERGYDTGAQGGDALIGDPRTAYDPTAGGGCTTLVFNTLTHQVERSFISINGTSVNCAGGAIGHSWFTCEETTEGVEIYGEKRGGFAKDHGYVFEVPASPNQMVHNPQPLRAMGRFRHEAVSKDDVTGNYFETEDNGLDSGFYRFVANGRGGRANPQSGGRLQMLKVRDTPQADLTSSYPIFTEFAVEWVDITEPDPAIGHSFPAADGTPFVVDAKTMEDAVFAQGYAAGGARFARLEGIWYDPDSGRHYFTSTSGGIAGLGQVWEYDDRNQRLRLVFESDSAMELDSPDNITVSPRSGLVLCEDGDGDQWLRGLTLGGDVYDFARNDVILRSGDPRPGTAGDGVYTDKEFAGATFSPDGQWLFFNIQTPGVSFALTGPWDPQFI